MQIKTVSVKQLKSDVCTVRFSSSVPSSRLEGSGEAIALVVQCPETKDISVRKARMFVRAMIAEARKHRLKRLVVLWSDIERLVPNIGRGELAHMLVVESLVANYDFTRYKEKPKQGWAHVEDLYIVAESQERKFLNKEIRSGKIMGDEVNDCRTLANTPGGDMTPVLLEKYVRKQIVGTGITLRSLKSSDMRKLGMGGVLGVARGSKEEPRFLIMEYVGVRTKDPIVLVGKGVTFDSGGLDIKPSPHAVDMQMDMSGGAAVIHAMIAVAKLKLTCHVVALIPAVENMPSGESFRPGDILQSLSGKTIEVLNTDAEGRIILADALTYAHRYKPSMIVDVATLTGATLAALGTRASAAFSNDDALMKILLDVGEQQGEYVWPLPLWEEFEADIKGNFADIANMPTKADWRDAGTVIAAVFLHQFAKPCKHWAHIDMASRMVASHDEFLSKGAVGAPVRLLVGLIEQNILSK